MAGGSSTSQRSSIASKSKSRASNASKASVRSNKSNADSGFAGYPVPWGSLIISAFCAVLHFELLDVSLFYVKNSCAGLYQVFYYKVRDSACKLGLNIYCTTNYTTLKHLISKVLF